MQALLNHPLWIQLENTPLAWEIGGTWLFPFLESIHVLAAAMVLGSLIMVDLRLLGLAARSYRFTTLSRELVPWTWGAFALAGVTGLGMFITRAASHVLNPAFQWKLLLLVLAGINMLVFHRHVFNRVETWDSTAALPGSIRLFGASSLLIWCAVMLAGRWVGHII